jgi:hypothetical protein
MTRISAAIVALCAMASSATAGTSDGYKFPDIEAQTPWSSVVYLAVFVAAVLVVGFKNARRTHLD